MATLFLSECGLRPLPVLHTQPRTSAISSHKPPKFGFLSKTSKRVSLDLGFKVRKWELKVSAPLRVSTDEEEEGVRELPQFDPGAPPPFTLADIRAAIPKHCWVKDPWKSMSYVVRDVVVVLGLAVVAAYVNSWFVWPLYWAAQGTMFWGLFVLGHDWYYFIPLLLGFYLKLILFQLQLVDFSLVSYCESNSDKTILIRLITVFMFYDIKVITVNSLCDDRNQYCNSCTELNCDRKAIVI